MFLYDNPSISNTCQVVGVFPGPKFDDAEGADQGRACPSRSCGYPGWDPFRSWKIQDVIEDFENGHLS